MELVSSKQTHKRILRCRIALSIIYTQMDLADFCATKDGTFGTLEMLLDQDVDVIFGPICSSGTL